MSDFIVKIFLKVAVGCSGAGGKKGKLFCGFWSVRWPRATHKCAYPCALGYFSCDFDEWVFLADKDTILND